MAITSFVANTKAKASEVNNNFNYGLSQIGLNTIRQLLDRAIEFSAGQIDGFGDAFVDSDGQLNSVDTTNTTATFDTNKYKYGGTSNDEIYINIPTGTFSSTISSAFGVGFYEDFEDGDSLQYKLTNASEDTGWLNAEEISNFTAFTSEPTKLIIKLVPKTGGTAGYPSIKGFWVYAE